MTLQVYTARVSTRDPDRFDVTRKSGGVHGTIFAPSWGILRPALDRMRNAKWHASMVTAEYEGCLDEARERAEHAAEAKRIETLAWDRYAPAYESEMRASYRMYRAEWEALLERKRVVLVCYCTDANHCHRTLLARILWKLGAHVRGEL
jgi:hypothetical protein